MKDFLEKIEGQTSKVIALDFDKVIHKSSKGFHDGTIYDEPVKGTAEALEYLSRKYTLVIFTCKASPDRPLVNGKTGVELIWEWLKKYDFDKYIQDVTDKKPRAKYYIDDKAIYFSNWEEVLEFI
ncbi:MAG: hypothetical protein ACFFG0_01140 [Candidatus Thorarchaeota archaeon]